MDPDLALNQVTPSSDTGDATTAASATTNNNTEDTQASQNTSVSVQHSAAYQYFFSETYQQLPKLRLAPDLMVYVNRSRLFRTWTGDTFDLNDWLVSANGGSGLDRVHNCSLTFYIPRHLETYFMGLGGRFILRPFHEVEIYAKGRFLVDSATTDMSSEAENFGKVLNTNDPSFPTSRYYRIFWGFISSIQSEWQEGDYQIVINCAPILRLFELTHFHSNLTTCSPTDNQSDTNPFANPGRLGNPIQVILSAYNTDVTVATEFNAVNYGVGPKDNTIDLGSAGSTITSYAKLANRALMAWRDRLKELQKRTTFFGLGWKDHNGKTNEDSMEFQRNEAMRQQVSAAQTAATQDDLTLRQQRLKKLQTHISTNKTSLSDVEGQITVTNNQISTLNEAIYNLKLGNQTDSVVAQIEAKEAQVDTLETTLATEEAQKKSLEDSISTDTAAAEVLQTEISKLAPSSTSTTTSSASVSSESSESIGPLNLYDILSNVHVDTATTPLVSGHTHAPGSVSGVMPNKDEVKDTSDLKFSLYIQDWAVTNYAPYFSINNFQMFNYNENRKRLDVISEMSDFIGYEFFQDLNGNVIFKPPFYNMDTRSDSIFVINDVDILTEQFIEDETKIVATNLLVSGSYHPTIESSTKSEIKPQAQWIDLRLIAKYGQRYKNVTNNMLRNADAAKSYAVLTMAKENRFATQMNMQIPARPELMLGFPVYLQGRDCFGYLERVQWSYGAGNDFTFNLTLSAIRRRIYINKKRLAEIKSKRSSRSVSENTNKGQAVTPAAGEPKQKATGASKTPATTGEQLPRVSGLNPFTLAQLTVTNTGLSNIPGQTEIEHLKLLVQKILVPLQALIGSFTISSAYRSAAVNAKIGGAAGSQHQSGQAADLKPSGMSLDAAYQKIKASSIPYGQVIREPRWIHISVDLGTPRRENLIATSSGGKVTGYKKDGTSSAVAAAASGQATSTDTPTTPEVGEDDYVSSQAPDTATVTGRIGVGSTLFDMVPLPNGVLQMYTPDGTATVKKSPVNDSGTQNTTTAEAQAEANTKAATAQATANNQAALDQAQAKVASAQSAYDTLAASLGPQITQLTSDKTALQGELESLTTTGSFQLDEAFPPDFARSPYDFSTDSGMASYISMYSDYQAPLLHDYAVVQNCLQTSASSAEYNQAKAAFSASNSAMTTSVLKPAYKYMRETLKTKISDIDTQVTSLQSQLDAAKATLDSATADAKTAQDTVNGNTPNANSTNDAKVDKTLGSMGQAAVMSSDELDDSLDSDPDSQIYAFGSDTFRDPRLKYQVNDTYVKRSAAMQQRYDKAAFFRPNTFSPYRIIVDDSFMGMLYPAVPKKVNEAGTASDMTSQDTQSKEVSQEAQNIAASADVQVTDVQNQITAKEASIKTDQTDISTYQAKVTDLTSKLSTASANATAFESAVSSAKATDDSGSYVYTAGEIEATIPAQAYNYCLYGGNTETLSDAQTYESSALRTDYISFLSASYTYYSNLQADYQSQLDSNQTSLTTAQSNLATHQDELNVLKTQLARYQGVSDAATNRANTFKTVANAATMDESGNAIAQMTIDQYMYLLRFQQPYTDKNGFEQIGGFAWGRSVTPSSAAEQLRLDATGRKFSEMSPQVVTKKEQSQQQSGTSTPAAAAANTTTQAAEATPTVTAKQEAPSSTTVAAPVSSVEGGLNQLNNAKSSSGTSGTVINGQKVT